MKIAVVTTHYPRFLDSVYKTQPHLTEAPSSLQVEAVAAELFGVADFYVSNLRSLDHEVTAIHANNERAQRAWAREHGLQLSNRSPSTLQRVARRSTRALFPSRPAGAWFERVLLEQVAEARPDLLLIIDMISVHPRLVRAARRYARTVVGQHAALELPYPDLLGAYDLVVSSFPPTLDRLRRKGVAAEPLRLGFEPEILNQLAAPAERVPVSFVGSFYPGIHDERVRLVERLCERIPGTVVFAPEIEYLSADSPIRNAYRGPAWGRKMYEVIRDSDVTINNHGDIPPYANNCRLYEATGVGTALVTDAKVNLSELFTPGRDVLAYDSLDECVAQVEGLLDDTPRREALAREGQETTLSRHTYRQRMEELVEVVRPLTARLVNTV